MSSLREKLDYFLHKVEYKIEKWLEKLEEKAVENSVFVIHFKVFKTADELADEIREMIDITKEKGYVTATIKTVYGDYFNITGQKGEITIPPDFYEGLEVLIHTHQKRPTLSGRDILSLIRAIDTLKKSILVVIDDDNVFFKVYSLKEDKREDFKKFLESIFKDERKYLQFRYDSGNINYDEVLSEFFDIKVYHDIERVAEEMFYPRRSPNKFIEAFKEILKKYDADLLDDLTEDIVKAVEDIIQKKTRG